MKLTQPACKRLLLIMSVTIVCLSMISPVWCKEIRLGMSAAFSGPTRGLGIELYRGSMAYLTHVNKSGGVHGNTIRIIAYDDGYNPAPTVENTMNLVEGDDVSLLFDYVGTPTVTRILPLLKKYNTRGPVFLFFPFSGAQPQREYPYGQYVFNLRASYRQELEALVSYLISKGRSRIGVFYQIDAYGRSGWEGVQRSLAKHNRRMVGEATYYRGTTYDSSMKEQVKILRSSSPDAIVSVGAYQACAAFIRDARDAGLNVPIANVSFVDSENQLKLLLKTGKEKGRDYTRNLINSQVVPSYEETDLPAVQEYRRLMSTYNHMPPRELMKEDYSPHKFSPVSLEGFLNAKMLVEILRRLGPGVSTSRIKPVVESIHDYDIGINVPVNFGPERHQGLDVVFLTTVEDGKFVAISDWNSAEK